MALRLVDRSTGVPVAQKQFITMIPVLQVPNLLVLRLLGGKAPLERNFPKVIRCVLRTLDDSAPSERPGNSW